MAHAPTSPKYPSNWDGIGNTGRRRAWTVTLRAMARSLGTPGGAMVSTRCGTPLPAISSTSARTSRCIPPIESNRADQQSWYSG
nr:hypothetical protein GCM10020241_61240 [Streptoalloteichus tenebrarius]